MTTIDVREIPPVRRHTEIHAAFEDLESGETLTIINDHEPKPLYYEMREEVDAFDAENYAVERRGPQEFVAEFPKK